MEKYKTGTNAQSMNEQAIIDNIIAELDKKREIAINKKQKTMLKDEGLESGEEEDAIDYLLLIIREGTVNCIKIKIHLMVPYIFFPKLK